MDLWVSSGLVNSLKVNIREVAIMTRFGFKIDTMLLGSLARAVREASH